MGDALCIETELHSHWGNTSSHGFPQKEPSHDTSSISISCFGTYTCGIETAGKHVGILGFRLCFCHGVQDLHGTCRRSPSFPGLLFPFLPKWSILFIYLFFLTNFILEYLLNCKQKDIQNTLKIMMVLCFDPFLYQNIIQNEMVPFNWTVSLPIFTVVTGVQAIPRYSQVLLCYCSLCLSSTVASEMNRMQETSCLAVKLFSLAVI